MLHLALKAFRPGRLPFPVMHVDTGHNFDEVLAARDELVAESGVRLVVAKVQDDIDAGRVVETIPSRNPMQTFTLLRAIRENKFDAAFGGARRDEEKARAKERVFSFRDEFGQWDPKAQRPELWNLYNGRHHKGEHIRVFPLSNWTEFDIWSYIGAEKIKLPSIYYAHERKVFERDGMLLAVHKHMQPRKDEPVIETDDAGGAIIGWVDNSRSSPGTWDQADVFASRVQANGTRAAGWAVNGTAISDTVRYQNELRVVRDGAGGAYFVWRDELRNTRVKRLDPSGVICPGWLPNSFGNQLGALAQNYQFRSPILHPSGDLIVPYQSPYSDSTKYDLFAARMKGDGSLAVVSVGPQATVSSDILVAPHPVGDRANFSITLRGGLPAMLELFAIDGRRVWQREVRSLGAGRHTVPFAASASLPAGVYQLRLTEGTTRMTRSVVRIR